MTEAQELEYAALLARAQQGDADAYERCLLGLTRDLRGYVRARVGDVPWVDDVVQDTLVSIHHARHTYDTRRSFAAWFYAIARHRLIDGIRRAKRQGTRETAVDLLPEPAAAPETSSAPGPLEAALARLPARQRHIITAMKVDGDSVRDVATDLGMSEGAVKVMAHRGYKALRRILAGSARHE